MDRIWEQVDESGAARLVDAITSLPALDYVLLLFGNDEMERQPFAGIQPALDETDLFVFSLPLAKRQLVPAQVWPALTDWRERARYPITHLF